MQQPNKAKSKTIQTTLWLPQSLWKAVRQLALDTDRSAKSIVIEGLEYVLQKPQDELRRSA